MILRTIIICDIILMFIHIPIHMSRVKTFTTTISAEMDKWLREEVKRQKVTRREILEKALLAYRIQAKKLALKESFKRANEDSETFNLAEMGMKDYFDNLIDFENGAR